MNAAEITGKSLENMVVVVNGAGAAGISCARMFIKAGVRKENLIMLVSKGVICRGRDNLTPETAELRTLARRLKELMSSWAFLSLAASRRKCFRA